MILLNSFKHVRHLFRERRRELNLSQQEVADRCGITRQGYARIEDAEDSSVPGFDTVIRIAGVLSIPINSLIGESPPLDSSQAMTLLRQAVEYLESLSGLSPAHRRLLSALPTLDNDQAELLLGALDALLAGDAASRVIATSPSAEHKQRQRKGG